MLAEIAIISREADCLLPFIVKGKEGLALASSGRVHLRAKCFNELHGTLDGAKYINRSRQGVSESGVAKLYYM